MKGATKQNSLRHNYYKVIGLLVSRPSTYQCNNYYSYGRPTLVTYKMFVLLIPNDNAFVECSVEIIAANTQLFIKVVSINYIFCKKH